LKTLGFVRRQVALSVSWQTTTVAAMGLVVGVPLGLAVGRLAWRAFATYLGVQVVPVVDTGVIVALCLATLVVANLLAVVPALMAARTRPMTLLRVE
jgi:predicted lysophospholipase L1 biosynthesis ABC-type transport system permease subunit